MLVKEASVKYVRDNLATTVDEVIEESKVIAITKFGKIKAYIVPKELYESFAESTIYSPENSLDAFEEIKGIWKEREDTKDAIRFSRKIRNSAHQKDFKI